MQMPLGVAQGEVKTTRHFAQEIVAQNRPLLRKCFTQERGDLSQFNMAGVRVTPDVM